MLLRRELINEIEQMLSDLDADEWVQIMGMIFQMSPEDKTAIKLMIAALGAYAKARKEISGAGWAEVMGWVDKEYHPILLFDETDNLTEQMLEVTKPMRQ